MIWSVDRIERSKEIDRIDIEDVPSMVWSGADWWGYGDRKNRSKIDRITNASQMDWYGAEWYVMVGWGMVG